MTGGQTCALLIVFFFFNDTATTEIYTLSLHDALPISPIKVAMAKSIPTYILVRSPVEAVTSNYLKEFAMSRGVARTVNKRLLGKLLLEYCNYYEFVLRATASLTLVDFRDVRENFLPTLFDINQRFDRQLSDSLIQDEAKRLQAEFRGAVDTLGSSTPNPEKERLKQPLKKVLCDLPEYAKAAALYSSLIKERGQGAS